MISCETRFLEARLHTSWTRRNGTNKIKKWPTSRQTALSFLKSKISLEEVLSTKKINSERQKKRKKEKGSEKERNHKTQMG